MADDEAGGDAPSPAHPTPRVPDRIVPAEGGQDGGLPAWTPVLPPMVTESALTFDHLDAVVEALRRAPGLEALRLTAESAVLQQATRVQELLREKAKDEDEIQMLRTALKAVQEARVRDGYQAIINAERQAAPMIEDVDGYYREMATASAAMGYSQRQTLVAIHRKAGERAAEWEKGARADGLLDKDLTVGNPHHKFMGLSDRNYRRWRNAPQG